MNITILNKSKYSWLLSEQRTILLLVFFIYVYKFKRLKIYSDETKLSVYRSLMCIYFFSYSLENFINEFKFGFNDPLNYHSNNLTDIAKWFMSYLFLDILIMIFIKNKRIDLYIHHIWCLMTFIIGFYNDKIGYFYNFVLLNEIISIVSGIDSMFIQDGDLESSRTCKIYRKNVIKYVRLPIWITILLSTLYKANELPNIIFYNTLLTSLLMIYLDRYWEKKCDKVIYKKDLKQYINK